MNKNVSKPSSPTAWIDTLDPEDIAAAYEEATVDAHDEVELIPPLPEGAVFLAACLDWRRRV